jgi:hypothetical protein
MPRGNHGNDRARVAAYARPMSTRYGAAMRPFLLWALLAATGASAANAACVASAAAQRPHLIELYTSEGCSSCPPAERWLSTLRGNAGYAPLEFHVDYWDTRDWRDPYADARYVARQRESARRSGRGIVYTPQVFVDGRLWKDWPKAPPPDPPALPAPALSLSVAREDALVVKVETDADAMHVVAVALTEDRLSNQVDGGENRGARLAHDHVVRAFDEARPARAFVARLRVPEDTKLANASIVGLVQERRSGDVVQVVRLALASCFAGPT